MAVVAIYNLCKRFGSVQAVDGISLTVNEGEFVTLLGPSGCGKTTSLRLIGGLEENDSGEIIIGDQVVSAPAKGILVPPEKRGLGMVFQSYAIWPHMTVFNNVAFPLRIRRFSKATIKEKGANACRDRKSRPEVRHAAKRRPAATGGDRSRAGC
jgi:iron(III) transport system ATP-binding protein